jgi:hypothetical protein
LPKLNVALLLYNVRDAREQLEVIEKALAAGTADEDGLQVWFDHAFHHLNFAWNARHSSSKRHSGLTDEDFNRWSKFPRDININRLAIPRRKRKK